MVNLPATLTDSTLTNRAAEPSPNNGSISCFASREPSPTARSRSPSSHPASRHRCSHSARSLPGGRIPTALQAAMDDAVGYTGRFGGCHRHGPQHTVASRTLCGHAMLSRMAAIRAVGGLRPRSGCRPTSPVRPACCSGPLSPPGSPRLQFQAILTEHLAQLATERVVKSNTTRHLKEEARRSWYWQHHHGTNLSSQECGGRRSPGAEGRR
jgi:hypothetical protein